MKPPDPKSNQVLTSSVILSLVTGGLTMDGFENGEPLSGSPLRTIANLPVQSNTKEIASNVTGPPLEWPFT
jgi:hypothetical protein